ncbi:TetR/AcrR family transcriptional regulator [Intestinibacter sp.]|uniref:TetR/AcrR family transcriptional regulator n=1 Tax=Intestinibacter sp. TaxID=1965304 RepID=UPI002A756BCA|nr:TetR/AcrR family transcriptional regulator [Intestinibacter sp.]MDY2735165.1 TetR/AcrR family transcriptional regulator [Intestinibacter sp.]MDY4575713.1 TetR/AcrR family transcriptional regulator [Intestinibacter sp.]
MNRVNCTNIIVKESITQALLILMESKDFQKITITEIVNKAGVARMSFYRNYDSKEDVILKHLQEIHNEWSNNVQDTNISDFIMTLFRLFESMKPTIELLYKADLSHLLLRFINELCGAKAEQSNIKAYNHAIIAASFFGWYDEWLKRGSQESPEEMLALFKEDGALAIFWSELLGRELK